jgi:hypothetical protein
MSERDAIAVLDKWAKRTGRAPTPAGPGPASKLVPTTQEQRREVLASGVRWPLYYDRRRRGQTHEQALENVDRRRLPRKPCCPYCGAPRVHTSMPEHGSEQRKGAS